MTKIAPSNLANNSLGQTFQSFVLHRLNSFHLGWPRVIPDHPNGRKPHEMTIHFSCQLYHPPLPFLPFLDIVLGTTFGAVQYGNILRLGSSQGSLECLPKTHGFICHWEYAANSTQHLHYCIISHYFTLHSVEFWLWSFQCQPST